MYRPLAKDGVVRKLIAAVGAAPSIHNTQPWRFWVTDDVVEVHGDPDRMLWAADPRGRALHLSCGAALFNVLSDRSARLTRSPTPTPPRWSGLFAPPRCCSATAGTPAADLTALQDILLRVSRLADDLPQVAELDLNPVIARPDGAHVVGARMRVLPAQPADPYLRRLR
jgi:nitroreductase